MSRPKHRSASARDPWEFEGDARFEVRRRLGSGSFGTVFEVFDRTRGARVALKLLRRVEPGDLYRFKQEFRALADVAHPNLVELYELSGEGDRWFFTMELVEGTNVLAFVRPATDAAFAPTIDATLPSDNPVKPAGEAPLTSDPRLPEPTERGRPGFDELRVRSTLVQLVEGLSALHESGKMHRDVKPPNVLVTGEGRVVIVDFGLSVRLSSSAAMSRIAVVGTPEYLAPEIVRGHAATAASDWYGVGVLLYEELAGRLPFAGTLHEILTRKLEQDPLPPSSFVEGVPPDLDQLCMELMARDPAARPTGEALLERVGGAIEARSGRREIPFVGRSAERAALAGLFDPVEARRAASVALLGGPSGIGKSALLNRVCDDLRRRAPGVLLLTARCYEQESVPYKAIDGLIDPLSRYLKQLAPRVVEAILPRDVRTLAWLFPVLNQVDVIGESPVIPIAAHDPHERRRRAVQALRDLLTRIAQRGPVVIVIDDLHWGDRDSALLLVDLLTPPLQPPLFLLVAYRSAETETSACLRTLLPALEARRGPELHVASLTLGALDEPDARALARALLPEKRAADDDLCDAISREARGRPFLVRELCELQGRREARDGQAEEVSIDALVRARVAALPPGPRRLLELLSIAGRPIDRAAAMRAAELGHEGPSAHLLLRNARLIRGRDAGDQDELEPYHDRIREAVAAGLSPERRADGSRRLAAALEGTGRADPETLAVYYLDGGDRGRAIELVRVAAADAARALAFDGAARLERLALELMPADDPGRAAVHQALGDAMASAGRGREAAEAFVAAAEGATPDHAFELRRRAAEQLLAAGYVDEGLARLRGCLAETGLRVPQRVWVAALGTVFFFVLLSIRGLRFRARRAEEVPRAALRRLDACETAARALNGVDTPLGAYFAVRATLLALEAGEPNRVFEALILFALYGAVLHGRPASGVRRARARASEIGEGLGLAEAPVLHRLALGLGAFMEGDLRAMRAELAPVVPALRELPTGRIWAMNVAQETRLSGLNWTGAWRELAEALPEAVAEARARDNRWLVRSLSLRFAHLPRLLDDDPEGAAKAHAAAREGWWPSRFSLLDSVSMIMRADIHLYAERGRGPSAHRLIESLRPSLARAGLLRLRGPTVIALHGRARSALAFAASEDLPAGEREAALAMIEELVRRLAALDSPMSRGFGRLAEAGLASARGDASAATAWTRAEEALSAAACDHLAAAAKRRRGALVGGEEGAKLVAEADAWLATQGAKDPGRLAAMLAPG